MTDLAPSSRPASAPAAPPTSDPVSADAEIRRAIVNGAIRAFRELPFHEVTFEVVAAEAEVETDMIVRQFGTFDGLVLATLDRWNLTRMAPVLPLAERRGAVGFLRGIVEANIADPAFMRFLTALLNMAAMPEHPLAHPLRQDWRQFHQLVQQQLAADIRSGLEPSTMEPARGAEQLIAMYEGLQFQAMVRPGMDLLDSYDRAVTRLRTGWARAYVKPVWEL